MTIQLPGTPVPRYPVVRNPQTPGSKPGMAPHDQLAVDQRNPGQHNAYFRLHNPFAQGIGAHPTTTQAPNHGPSILNTQHFLIAHGYHIQADGLMGPQTHSAMMDFNQNHGGPRNPVKWNLANVHSSSVSAAAPQHGGNQSSDVPGGRIPINNNHPVINHKNTNNQHQTVDNKTQGFGNQPQIPSFNSTLPKGFPTPQAYAQSMAAQQFDPGIASIQQNINSLTPTLQGQTAAINTSYDQQSKAAADAAARAQAFTQMQNDAAKNTAIGLAGALGVGAGSDQQGANSGLAAAIAAAGQNAQSHAASLGQSLASQAAAEQQSAVDTRGTNIATAQRNIEAQRSNLAAALTAAQQQKANALPGLFAQGEQNYMNALTGMVNIHSTQTKDAIAQQQLRLEQQLAGPKLQAQLISNAAGIQGIKHQAYQDMLARNQQNFQIQMGYAKNARDAASQAITNQYNRIRASAALTQLKQGPPGSSWATTSPADRQTLYVAGSNLVRAPNMPDNPHLHYPPDIAQGMLTRLAMTTMPGINKAQAKQYANSVLQGAIRGSNFEKGWTLGAGGNWKRTH